MHTLLVHHGTPVGTRCPVGKQLFFPKDQVLSSYARVYTVSHQNPKLPNLYDNFDGLWMGLADTLSSCLRRCSSMTWRISSCHTQTLLCQGRGEDWIPMEELLIEEHSALELQKLQKFFKFSG